MIPRLGGIGIYQRSSMGALTPASTLPTSQAGLNGDSIPFVPESFWAASVAAEHPLALEAEGGTNDAALNWSTMGWGWVRTAA